MNMRLHLRTKVILLSTVVILLSQIFIAGLNAGWFEKEIISALLSNYGVVGGELKRQIELGIRFGKPVDRIFGVENLMKELKKKRPELKNIEIFDDKGKVIYSLTEASVGTIEPKSLLQKTTGKKTTENHEEIQSVLWNGAYHILLPITTETGSVAADIDLSFPTGIVHSRLKTMLIHNILWAIATSLAGILTLHTLFKLFIPKGTLKDSKRRAIIIIGAVLVVAQIVYSVSNVDHFKQAYIQLIRSKVDTQIEQLKSNIERLLNKGISITKLTKIDETLDSVTRTLREIESIKIYDNANNLIYSSENKANTNISVNDDQRYIIRTDLSRSYSNSNSENQLTESKEGSITATISRNAIVSMIKKISYDSATVIFISFLFSLEMIIFIMVFLTQASDRAENTESASLIYMIARPVAFTFLFSTAFCVSFIPLQMQELYKPVPWISEKLVLALPIFLEICMSMIAAISAGTLIDRIGWHRPFIGGVILCAVGNFLSGIAFDGIQFIACRALTGLGYGFAWMSIQGYVFTHTSPSHRARGISNLVAGIISGQICGMAVGAMLAERIGYQAVMLTASALAVVPLILVFVYMRPYFEIPRIDPVPSRSEFRDMARFLMDRNVFSILMLSLVPFSICQVGLIQYIAPIYLHGIGATQSDIGRVLMIYGLCTIYIAPLISNFIDQSPSKKTFIAAGGIIGGLGLMAVFFYHGMSAIMGAVFLLGLSSSMIGSAQTAFALKLKITKEIGAGQAMSIQRAADKLGQMLGPVFMGSVVAAFGMNNGVAICGLFFIFTSFLFIIVAREVKG